MDKFYTRKDVGPSEIQIMVTLPKDAFAKVYDDLLHNEIKNVEVKGFRKGMYPKDALEKQIKPAILKEAFEKVAPYYVNAALITEKIMPVAPVQYADVSKIEVNAEITFTAKVTVMPTFKLGNLKKIKPTTKDEGVTKEDLEKTLDNMLKNNQDKVKSDKIDDKWAKEIATFYKFPGITDLEDLKKTVSKVIEAQKKSYVRQAQEAEVVREAVKMSKIEIPHDAIDYEAQQRESTFINDLKSINTSLDDFLKKQNLTMDTLRDMWHKDAHEALENDTLFKTYASEKGLTIEESELEAEINQIRVANAGKNVDEGIYNDPSWKEYIKSYALKQKAFRELVNEILGEFVPVDSSEVMDAAQEKDSKKETVKKSSKSRKDSKK